MTQRAKATLKRVFLFIALGSGMILFIPLSDENIKGGKSIVAVTIAMLFWLFMFFAYYNLYKFSKQRVDIIRAGASKGKSVGKSFKMREKQQKPKRLNGIMVYSKSLFKNIISMGLFRFFKNRESRLADAVLIISLGMIVLFSLMKADNDWVFAIVLFIFFVSLQYHCILNGKMYESVQNSVHEGKGRNVYKK